MQITFSSFLCLLLIATALSISAQAQDKVKAIVFGHTVEFVQEEPESSSTPISIVVDGKLLKRFDVQNVSLPYIAATSNDFENNYLVYKSFSGNTVCPGGDVFVLKFYTYGEKQDIRVLISPILNCLEERASVSFEYDAKANFIIKIGSEQINGDSLSRWIKSHR